MMTVYLAAVAAVWVWRVLWLARMASANPPIPLTTDSIHPASKVSVIVPAKNEEKNIARCLHSLFGQSYKNMEIICVNDRSTDRTLHLLENFKKLSPFPFRIVTIEKLPQGWTGKNHAMFAASKIASGEWLLFTDADTTHAKGCLSSAIGEAVKKNIDFLTLAPETESHSFWEKTVQPLAVGSLALWFQSHRVNDPTSDRILANGQFILVKKEVYEKVGGNESVRTEVIEDVELAKKIKSAGFNIQFLNGTKLYRTRMYNNLHEIKTGWTRIFTYLFNKNAWAVLHKIFLLVFVSLGPFFIFFAEATKAVMKNPSHSWGLFWGSAGLCALIVLIRWMGNRLLKSDPKYALLHPLGCVIMIWILSICIVRIMFNRPSVWRGDMHK